MQIFGHNIMNLKRSIDNLIGRLTGHEKCTFCGDRKNWKPWVDPFDVESEGKSIYYDVPVCERCFRIQQLIPILGAVREDIDRQNNFCLSFGAAPIYGESERELIIGAVEALKDVDDGK